MIKTEKILFFVATVMLFLVLLTEIVVPVLIGLIIDQIIKTVENDTQDKDKLLYFGMLIILAGLANYVFQNVDLLSLHMFRSKLSMVLRADVFEALQKQSFKYYDNVNTGEIVARSTSDIREMENGYTAPGRIFVSILHILIIFVILFVIDTLFALIGILSIPMIWFFQKKHTKNFTPLYEDTRREYGSMNKILQENIDGATVIRSLNVNFKEEEKFDLENSANLDTWLKISKLNSTLIPRTMMIAPLISAIILVVGGYRVLSNDITVGMLITAVFLSQMIWRPVRTFVDTSIDWTIAKTSAIRVFDILQTSPEIVDIQNAIELSNNSKGEISFEEVHFSYKSEAVIENISFNVRQGEKVTILGATGSGKSSLINLIPRFYDTTSGSVKINGIDVREYKQESLRSQIGFVHQESFLFSRSIYENIGFGKPTATEEEIISVAKLAQAHDFISNLEDGYNTIIGERGMTLSGGQRQRLSIARALLKDPLIVIFDDSLSSVDVQTEKKIQIATDKLLKNRTTVIISQRLNTINNTDLIIILEKGKIVEMGSPDDLSSRDGIFKQMLEVQIDGILHLKPESDLEVN